jgi:ribonucleoside-diphosphate reductase alpha chain
MFLDNTSCNLASLNLLKFLTETGCDTEGFEHTVDVMFTAMEVLVSNAFYPTEHIEEETKKFRPLGLGYGNLGALLMRLGLGYDSSEGRWVASVITSQMTAAAYARSSMLGERMGPFEGLQENEEPMEAVLSMHSEATQKLDDEHHSHVATFDAALSSAQQNWKMTLRAKNWRNSQATVLAPMGTIGFFLGVETTGCEPVTAPIQYKKLVGGGQLRIICDSYKKGMEALGYGPTDIASAQEWLSEHGNLDEWGWVTPEDLAVFDTALYPYNPETGEEGSRALHWDAHVRMLAAIQPFVSGSISKTVNMPNDSTEEDVLMAYSLAWKLGLKCLAIYRDGCKLFQPVSTKGGESREAQEEKPETLARGTRVPPPRRRPGEHFKFRVSGHKGYLQPGFDPDTKELIECFVRLNDLGSDINGWAETLMTAISIGLQYGVPLRDFYEKISPMDFKPNGFTDDPEIRSVKSIPGYMLKRLAMDWLPFEEKMELGLVQGGAPIEEPQEVTGEPVDEMPPTMPEGRSGLMCNACGSYSVRMVGAANCIICDDCGAEEGGCTG